MRIMLFRRRFLSAIAFLIVISFASELPAQQLEPYACTANPVGYSEARDAILLDL